MVEHVNAPFAQRHNAKLQVGLDASKGTPEGDGDQYFALDTDTLYVGDAGAWVTFGAGSTLVTSVHGRTGDVVAATSDYDAEQVDNTPAGNIAATDVQAAINELDTEKAAVSHVHSAADITSGVLDETVGGTGQSAFTQGDILIADDSTTLIKLAVGTDGQLLVADSAEASGVKWDDVATVVAVHDHLDSNGNEVLIFVGVPSAVNEFTMTNAVTTEGPTLSATGDDANISITIAGKGTGAILIDDSALQMDNDFAVRWGGDQEQIYGNSTTNTVKIQTSGSVKMTVSDTVSMFNEPGNDVDFVVRGNTEENLFYVDAGQDRIGIGTNNPQSMLHLSHATSPHIQVQAVTADTNPAMILQNDAQQWRMQIRGDGADLLEFYDNTAAQISLRLYAAGAVVVNDGGTSTVDFRAESDNDAFALFVDASADAVGIGQPNPTAKLHVYFPTTDMSKDGFSISSSFTPTTSSGSQWPNSAYISQSYNSDHTPSGGESTALVIRHYTGGSNTFNTVGQSTQIFHSGSGTLSSVVGLRLVTPTIDGSGAITTYTALELTASGATNNYAIRTFNGDAIFNENGNDYDFRVESDTNNYMLFVDAGLDRVGIGTSSPGSTLHVKDTAANASIYLETDLVDGSATYGLYNDTQSWLVQVRGGAGVDYFYIRDDTAGTDRLTINTAGVVTVTNSLTVNSGISVEGGAVFNDAGGAYSFKIEGDTISNLFLVSGANDTVHIGTSYQLYAAKLSVWGETNGIASYVEDAGTNTISNLLAMSHRTTNTPAADFGGQLIILGETTTTVDQTMYTMSAQWASATHATKTVYVDFKAYDYGGARRFLRGQASGTAAMIGFLGADAVIRQVVTGAPGSPEAHSSTLTALDNLGLITDSSAAGGVVFNEAGGDYDFRVESENETHILGVDASHDAVLMGGGQLWGATLTVYSGNVGVMVHAASANTNIAVSNMILSHDTSGTPAAGFGTKILFLAETTTATQQTQGTIQVAWAEATHASRKARMRLAVNDDGGSRTALEIAASGSAAQIGFFGTTAISKPEVTGSAASNAALASLLTVLEDLGLITDSST